MGLLEDIQVFIRVVEAGGIGKAAEQLNMAKSVVSRRLADLETRLATKLIQRTTRKSSLTDAGRLYYQQALSLLESVAEMHSQTLNENSALQGSLKLSLPLTFGLAHLTPVLEAFIRQYPLLNLQIDFSDREVDLVEEGFDLAFRIGKLRDSSIQARKIISIQYVMCASPLYVAQFGEPTSHECLKAHQILKYSMGNNHVWPLISPQGETLALHLPSKMQANNGSFLCDMAIAGHGIALLPTFIAASAIGNGLLMPLLSDYKIAETDAYAVYPHNKYLSHKTRVLIEFLVAHFAQGAQWDHLF